MKATYLTIALGTALVALPTIAASQDTAAVAPTGPCRVSSCQMLWDWGSGSTASNVQDRRYGPAADLEVLIPQYLKEHGFKVSPMGGLSTTINMRPRLRNAMCDQMAGTGTDMTCRTVGELAVQFVSTEPGAKLPSPLRITNRCAAGDVFMTIKDFSRYATDLIVYALADEKTRGRRPSSKC